MSKEEKLISGKESLMREIKFRAQRVDTKEWVYGDFIRLSIIDAFTYIAKGFGYKVRDPEIGRPIKVLPDTVGQYTGLRDRTGVEIYEGDIIHTNYFKDNGWNTKAFHENQEVKFEDGAFQLGDFTTLYECTSNPEYALEVIGNIYRNPELLI